MENITDCNIHHQYRLCSKESFFSANHTFNAYRDCSVAGVATVISVTFVCTVITVFGNILVPFIVLGNRTYWNPYGICRMWIGICDLLTGITYLPLRAMILIQILFTEHHYSMDQIENTLSVLKSIKQQNEPQANASFVGYNLEMIFKTYELTNYALVVSMSCILATYILIVPWFLFVMSVDRFTAIVHPFKYQKWQNTRKMHIMLTAVAFVSLFGGTIWPLANIDMFYPSVNNRFGLGPMFLLGRYSMKILVYHMLWAVPLFAVLGFNTYTAYYCMFVLSKASRKSVDMAGQRDTRKGSGTSTTMFLHKTKIQNCCNVCTLFCIKRQQENDSKTSTTLCSCFKRQVKPIHVSTISDTNRRESRLTINDSCWKQKDEAVEAFWVLFIMTAMFLVSLLPSFIFTTLISVPCEEAVHWTWLYASIQFLHMSHPCQNVIIYNFRSKKFREAGKRVIQKALNKLTVKIHDFWGTDTTTIVQYTI